MSQNHKAEQRSQAIFQTLQESILNTYGLHAPSPPVLRLRNATQTSIVLEWDPIVLATSTLRSLALYRNGSKAGNIPRPMDMLSTKISGLAINTEYSFYLVLKTSGGTYSSNTLTVKTHEMTNLTGITVTPGVLPSALRDALEATVERIDAKLADTVRIDTTHFVCTEPRGTEWSKAVEMNIPVVRPEWVDGCEREGKIVGVRGYYLDADPKLRQVGTNPAIQQQSKESMGNNPTSPPIRSSSIPQTQTPPTQSQSTLPTRGAPRSPEKEKVEGEPGPSVEPTPRLSQGEDWKEKDLPPHPSEEAEEDSDYSNSNRKEDSEKETSGLPAESSADESDDEASKATEEAARQIEKEKASIEDEKGDMEDVAL